jgi:hypothetical protein
MNATAHSQVSPTMPMFSQPFPLPSSNLNSKPKE